VTPQPPQLELVLVVSTHIPLHRLHPAGQTQVPFTQDPLPQLEPQAPQFARSLARFTQLLAYE
jgi:hypothetical protein